MIPPKVTILNLENCSPARTHYSKKFDCRGLMASMTDLTIPQPSSQVSPCRCRRKNKTKEQCAEDTRRYIEHVDQHYDDTINGYISTLGYPSTNISETDKRISEARSQRKELIRDARIHAETRLGTTLEDFLQLAPESIGILAEQRKVKPQERKRRERKPQKHPHHLGYDSKHVFGSVPTSGRRLLKGS